jgi:hypothetical protein
VPPTRVVHINDEVPDAIYIGRAVPRRGLAKSPWSCSYRAHRGTHRLAACERFAHDLLAGDRRHQLADLPALRGKPLACWCRREGEARRPWNACHGDVLVLILGQYSDDELRAMAATAPVPGATAAAAGRRCLPVLTDARG